MISILQISDPHFGTERQPVVVALERLAQAQGPSLVILSGDLTQRAKSVQFLAARQFLDRLHAPSSLVIPGNHDIPLLDIFTRLFDPYKKYRRYFGDDLEPVFETPELLVIGIKTTRWYRHVDGEVSDAQIERVAARLKRAGKSRLRIVVTHQPVHVTQASDEKNLLIRHAEAMRAWSTAGVDLVLGGHIHRPFFAPMHEQVAGISGRVWAVQAGTAVSSRVRFEAGNSVNIIRYPVDRPRNCMLERWDYDPEVNAFCLAESVQAQA